jgi:hypothetical protein
MRRRAPKSGHGGGSRCGLATLVIVVIFIVGAIHTRFLGSVQPPPASNLLAGGAPGWREHAIAAPPPAAAPPSRSRARAEALERQAQQAQQAQLQAQQAQQAQSPQKLSKMPVVPALPDCPQWRLAIYQPESYHTEMFGYLLQYAHSRGMRPVIYYAKGTPQGKAAAEDTSMLPVYRRMYGTVGAEADGASDGRGAYRYDSGLDVRPAAGMGPARLDYTHVLYTTTYSKGPVEDSLITSDLKRYYWIVHQTKGFFRARWQMSAQLLYTAPLVGRPFALPVYHLDAWRPGIKVRSRVAAMLAGPDESIGDAGGVGAGINTGRDGTADAEPYEWPVPFSRRAQRTVCAVGSSNVDPTQYPVNNTAEFFSVQPALQARLFLRIRGGERRKMYHGGWSPNVRILEGADSEQVIAAVQLCGYLLVLPKRTAKHVTMRMTGAVPLAAIARTPLIMPADMAASYGVPDGCFIPVSYAEGLTAQVATTLLGMDADRYDAMVRCLSDLVDTTVADNRVTLDHLFFGENPACIPASRY